MLLATAAQGEVQVPNLFGDHMVLQRGRPVPVFGTAASFEPVMVAFNGQSRATTADAQGHWRVTLAAMNANPIGQTLTITFR